MLMLTRRFMRSMREDGVLGTAHRARYHCYERYREWSLGVTTASLLSRTATTGDDECRPYEPLCYSCIDRAMSHLKPTSDDALLDYGCGRGRILAVAATYPFRKVIGIDRSPDLCDSARENLRRIRGRRSKEWNVVEGDAAMFVVPDEVTVAFLFNPFLGQVLSSVVQRLKESVKARPRQLSVIYMNPEFDRDVFAECPWLSLRAELPVGLWQGMRFRHYQSFPEAPQ